MASKGIYTALHLAPPIENDKMDMMKQRMRQPIWEKERICECGNVADRYGDPEDDCRLLQGMKINRHGELITAAEAFVTRRQQVHGEGYRNKREQGDPKGKQLGLSSESI
jgi:hypothetical protein